MLAKSKYGVRKKGYSRSWCLECEAESRKQWRKDNPGKSAAQYKAYREAKGKEWHAERMRKWRKSTGYKDGYLRATYGISLAEYQELLTSQGGGCAICGSKGTKRSLAVDHDHKTGKVRGLLCRRCNSGIGWFKDNPKSLETAASYLRNPPFLAHPR